MTAQGQAAYEALHESIRKRIPTHTWLPWEATPDALIEVVRFEDFDAAARAVIAAQPQDGTTADARPLAGLMPVGLYFDDADPVARCLVGDCRWHGHGDSVNDAVTAWTAHLAKDHRNDWPEDAE